MSTQSEKEVRTIGFGENAVTVPAEYWEMEWFLPLLDYVLSRACSQCKANAGVECDAPQKRRREDPMHRQHRVRVDAGTRHYHRDVMNAPWMEEREPGRHYSTLTLPGGASPPPGPSEPLSA